MKTFTLFLILIGLSQVGYSQDKVTFTRYQHYLSSDNTWGDYKIDSKVVMTFDIFPKSSTKRPTIDLYFPDTKEGSIYNIIERPALLFETTVYKLKNSKTGQLVLLFMKDDEVIVNFGTGVDKNRGVNIPSIVKYSL